MPALKREERIRRAIADYVEGEDMPQVGDRTGLPLATLYRWARKLGAKVRPIGQSTRVINPRMVADVMRLSEEAWTVKRIARHLGISMTMVERIRHREDFRAPTLGATFAPGRQVRELGPDGKVVAKWCPECKQMLPAEEFWGNKWSKDRLQHQCKSCQDARRRAGRAS